MYNATLFMNERLYDRGLPCFGVRFDNQALPKGSVGLGFFRTEGPGAPVYSLLDDYYTSGLDYVQSKNLNQAIKFAVSCLNGEEQELLAILQEGLL